MPILRYIKIKVMRDQQLKQFSDEVSKGFQDALQYKRFNRHDIFDGKDTSLVLDIIHKVDRYDHDGIGHDTANMLYGLFDGYWYDSLQSNLESISTVPASMIDELNKLLNRIDAYIDVNGVTYTRV